MKPLPMRLGDLSVGFVQALADAVRNCGHDPAPCSISSAWTRPVWPNPWHACRSRAICAWVTPRLC